MDWSEERYVKVYTRDTADLLAFGFEGRAVWWELIRKVDRAGVLDHGGDLEVVAELLRVPPEVFTVGIAKIAKRGCVKLTETALVIPNFMPAQEARQSDATRQRESRARRREFAIGTGVGEAVPVTASHTVSHDVTRGHTASQNVTPRLDKTRQDKTREDLPAEPAPLELELVGVEPQTRASDPKPPTGDHATFIADFSALYAEANGGAKPTWGARQGKAVKELLAAHGLAECMRRSANMFRAPPDWPPKPHDFTAFVKHFDLFAQPFRRTGGHFKVTGDETYAGGEVKI